MTSLISSTARPLPLLMRRDLVVRRQRWQGREYWTVKDPLALKYYRFENEEFAILAMLDGQTSSNTIRERFERDFAPQRISATQLQHLLSMLHRSNLVVADAAGQGAPGVIAEQGGEQGGECHGPMMRDRRASGKRKTRRAAGFPGGVKIAVADAVESTRARAIPAFAGMTSWQGHSRYARMRHDLT